MDPGTLMPTHFGDGTTTSLIGVIEAYSFRMAQYMRLYLQWQKDLDPKRLLDMLIQYHVKTNTELPKRTN